MCGTNMSDFRPHSEREKRDAPCVIHARIISVRAALPEEKYV
jgi:hypothetical protein